MPTQPTQPVNYFDNPPADEPESEPETYTADPAPQVDPTPAPAQVSKGRRNRGDLEMQVKSVCDDLVVGAIEIEGPHTPYRIAGVIGERTGDKAPSVGAVTAVLKRWVTIGFAVASEKPFAFSQYTEDAANVGLAALRERHRAIKKAERKQARAEAKAAEAAALAGGMETNDNDTPF